MSILSKCEEIGLELRQTEQGQLITKLHKEILQNPPELTVEFFELINHNYVKIHFFSAQHAIDILKGNVNNQIVGQLVRKILTIEGLQEFADANIPLGIFAEKLSLAAFTNTVKYELPSDIRVTPALIRLSNSLTVECQRLNLVQQFIKEFHTSPDFKKAIERFDELSGTIQILPYSKEDRGILKTLRREYPDTPIDLVHSLICTLSYIKCTIFDAFYGNLFEIYEIEDVLDIKTKPLDRCRFIKLVLVSNERTLPPNRGWILKFYGKDGTVKYGQIFNKQIKFTRENSTVTIKALIHDIL